MSEILLILLIYRDYLNFDSELSELHIPLHLLIRICMGIVPLDTK